MGAGLPPLSPLMGRPGLLRTDLTSSSTQFALRCKPLYCPTQFELSFQRSATVTAMDDDGDTAPPAERVKPAKHKRRRGPERISIVPSGIATVCGDRAFNGVPSNAAAAAAAARDGAAAPREIGRTARGGRVSHERAALVVPLSPPFGVQGGRHGKDGMQAHLGGESLKEPDLQGSSPRIAPGSHQNVLEPRRECGAKYS